MKILSPTPAAIDEAVQALKNGQLVAFPTETVYGLGANAADENALQKLYAAKGRPSDHPVIVHLASHKQMSDWAVGIPQAAVRLATALWPGPLTLILPRQAHVSDKVTGGQNSVGLRVPNHPLALTLLQKFGGGIAAPSANRFGRLSPTSAEDVAAEFADEVAIVLDGGSCDVGIESTIVDFSSQHPRILRPGMILPEQIEAIAQVDLLRAPGSTSQQQASPRVPGGLPSHYAPVTPLHLVPSEQLLQEIERYQTSGKKVCVLSFQGPTSAITWITAPPNARRYAQQLYGSLRKLDAENADYILVENVPSGSDWEAIADRLQRASVAAEAIVPEGELP